jgi:hypothetical protein
VTKIQSLIADHVHDYRLVDDGDFALGAAEHVARTKSWDLESIAAALSRTKTTLFQINSSVRKAEFIQELAEQILTKCERPMPDNENNRGNVDQSVHFHGPVSAKVLQTGQHAKATIKGSGRRNLGVMVEPAYLDPFKLISKVSAAAVKDVELPITLPEVTVRKAFEQALGESFHATDSGVESCDTFSLQGSHDGKQCAIAAMFKGARDKSLKWPLQVAGCGKNGNQVVKLFEVPADVHIVQANGPLDPTLVKHIQDTADAHSARGKSVKFMLIDGVSTARLLRALKIL